MFATTLTSRVNWADTKPTPRVGAKQEVFYLVVDCCLVRFIQRRKIPCSRRNRLSSCANRGSTRWAPEVVSEWKANVSAKRRGAAVVVRRTMTTPCCLLLCVLVTCTGLTVCTAGARHPRNCCHTPLATRVRRFPTSLCTRYIRDTLKGCPLGLRVLNIQPRRDERNVHKSLRNADMRFYLQGSTELY